MDSTFFHPDWISMIADVTVGSGITPDLLTFADGKALAGFSQGVTAGGESHPAPKIS